MDKRLGKRPQQGKVPAIKRIRGENSAAEPPVEIPPWAITSPKDSEVPAAPVEVAESVPNPARHITTATHYGPTDSDGYTDDELDDIITMCQ